MITGLAMAEYEKKLHAGDNLIGSTRIVLAIQSTSSTTLFKYCKDISQASRRILLSLCMIRIRSTCFKKEINVYTWITPFLCPGYKC